MPKCACAPEGESEREEWLIGDGRGLSVDAALELLSHGYRREILLFLRSNGNRVHIDSLIDELLTTDTQPTTKSDNPDDRETIYTHLYHQHLPKLIEHGLITTDDDMSQITYQGDPVLEELLDAVETLDE